MLQENLTHNNDCAALGFSIEFPVNQSDIDNLEEEFVQKLVVFHSLICLFGIAGNLLSLSVIIREKNLQTIPNLYVAHLAAADLLICLLMPVSAAQLLTNFHIPEPWCRIVGYLITMSLGASLFSMVLIAVNRYILLVKGRPRYLQIYTNTRVVLSILIVWIWLGLNIVIIPEAGFGYFGYSHKFHSCSLRSYCFLNYLYVVTLMALAIYLPGNIAIGWSYIHILFKLYRIWKKVKKREIRIRRISEAMSERSDMITNAGNITNSTTAEMNPMPDLDLNSDDDHDDDDVYDSEEDTDILHKISIQRLHSDSVNQKRSLMESFRLAEATSSRRPSSDSRTSKDSTADRGSLSKERRRSSCLPLPQFHFKLKFEKPQWKKRCLAITNMITIYVILWVCWTPLILQYIVDRDGLEPAYTYHIEMTFVYLNSAFNVLLYSLMNNSLRKAHYRLLCKCFKSRNQDQSGVKQTSATAVEMTPISD